MLTGRLSFKGEMGLGIRLGMWIRKAVAEQAAAASGTELEVAEREKWGKDEDAQCCAVCRQEFKVGGATICMACVVGAYARCTHYNRQFRIRIRDSQFFTLSFFLLGYDIFCDAAHKFRKNIRSVPHLSVFSVPPTLKTDRKSVV